jgi:hypothetical protein
VALLFLYLEFPRMLQFLRLRRDDRADMAIEVVMVRHEVSVLRRQVERQSLLTGVPMNLYETRADSVRRRCWSSRTHPTDLSAVLHYPTAVPRS